MVVIVLLTVLQKRYLGKGVLKAVANVNDVRSLLRLSSTSIINLDELSFSERYTR
jgi:enolase